MSRLHAPRLLVQVYAILLATVLMAEVLIFTLVAFSRPPAPPVHEFAAIVQSLETGHPHSEGLVVKRTDDPHAASRGDSRARQLADLVAQASNRLPDDVAVSLPPIGPGGAFGARDLAAIRSGGLPQLIIGDFRISARGPDGRWILVSTGDRLAREVRWRVLLLLIGTLIVVMPFAWLLARHLTRPVHKFADAATRLGTDPLAPPIAIDGPREIQEAARAFNEMQGRLQRFIHDRTTMLAAMAHDVRTPLMRMALHLDRVPEPQRSKLQQQIDVMRDMVDGILQFVREHRDDRPRERIDLVALIQAIADDAVDAGGDVSFHHSGGSSIVSGDLAALKSIFRNLVANALAYGQRAAIALREERTSIVVTVDDNGPGLPAFALEKVFEPFFRMETSRNNETGGIGLGLAVVRTNILMHGGAVCLSNRESGGLRAEVLLPKDDLGHLGSTHVSAPTRGSDRREKLLP